MTVEEMIINMAGATVVTDEEWDAIKRNSAFMLPDSPAEHGMRAGTVKQLFWRAIVGKSKSDACTSVRDVIARLISELNHNTEAAQALFEKLLERIEQGDAALREADTALGERIDGEATARTEADTALGERIDGEATARTEADRALGERIYAEQKAREEADTALEGEISALRPCVETLMDLLENDKKVTVDTIREVLAAFENAPNGTNIANEFTALREKDAVLEGEISALREKDAVLEGEISALREKDDELDSAISALQGSVLQCGDEVGRTAEEIAVLAARADIGEKKLANLEARISPEEFIVRSGAYYTADVPAAALPYASVDRIGTVMTSENLFVTLDAITDTGDKYEDGFEDGSYRVKVSHDANDPTVMTLEFGYVQTVSCSVTLGKILLPAGTYTVSGAPGGNEDEGYIKLKLIGTATFVDAGNSVTFSIGADEELTAVLAFENYDCVSGSRRDIRIMLVEGSERASHVMRGYYNQLVKIAEVVSTDREGAVLDTLPIPVEVQALFRMAGDEVDLENRLFKSYLVSLTLPNIGWSKSTSYIQNNFNTSKLPKFDTDRKKEAVLEGYTYDDQLSEDRTWYVVSSNGFRLRDARFATAEAFVAHLEENPLTITYVSQTAYETDISELVSADNFIRVAGGGKLTFVNGGALAVPVIVTYQQEVTE